MTIPKLASPESPAEPTPDVVPARRGVQRAPESVPPTVRSELEPVLGDSLSDVKVHRGPETAAAARSIQAKAFTTGGAVYLPDEHGPTSSGEGRKILAHELTHVVQQRSFGGSLPPEDSTEGARLEHEAKVVGGQAPVPTRPIGSAPPVARPAAAGQPQRLAGSPMPTPSWSLPAVPDDTSSRAGGSLEGSALPPSSAAVIAATVQAAATRAGVPSSPAAAATPPASASAPSGGTPSGEASAGGVQRLPAEESTAATGSSSATAPTPSRTSDVSAPAGGGPTDLDDLERQLYPRIRTRLRRDLLADRERSGRLFDR